MAIVKEMTDKTPSKADFYLEYDNRKITLYDAKNYVETIFMKLYPEYDIDETTVPVSNNTVEEDQPKGNGSGFFISTNVIATNSVPSSLSRFFNRTLNDDWQTNSSSAARVMDLNRHIAKNASIPLCVIINFTSNPSENI